MTQNQIEQLTQEEYSYFLAFGESIETSASIAYGKEDVAQNTVDSYLAEQSEFTHQEGDWISTLVSTTCPDLTYGYSAVPCMYTVV